MSDDRYDGMDEVERRLREQRADVSSLELDRLKTRAISQAKRSRGGGRRSAPARVLATLLSLGLLAGGTGGVLAASSNSTKSSNAAAAAYGNKRSPKRCSLTPDPAQCRANQEAQHDQSKARWDAAYAKCDSYKPAQQTQCRNRVDAEKAQQAQACEDESQQYKNSDFAEQQCLYKRGVSDTPPPGS